MIKKEIILIFILLFFFKAFAQNNAIDKVNYALKLEDYDKAHRLVKQIKNRSLKSLYLGQINYYLEGKKPDSVSFSVSEMPTIRDSIVFYYLKADMLAINKRSDKKEEIHDNYLKSYRFSLKENDSLLISETLKRICNHLLFKSRNDTVYVKQYINKLKKYSKDNTDVFWNSYYQLLYNGLLKDFMIKHKMADSSYFKSYKKKEMKSLFETLRVSSENIDSHRALYYKILSAYQADWLKDYTSANRNIIKSKRLYQKSNYWYSRNKAKGLDYNMALNYYYNKEYSKAIPILEKDLSRDKKKLYIMYTYEYLYLCYKALNKTGKALYSFEEMHKVKDELDQVKYAIAIKEINEKYNKKEIQIALDNQKDKNKSLEKRLMAIVPIFGLISFILIIVFYLYKRYKKKSNILEEEQSETLQKLDELKSIVIKNHIILKDKTKVYILDLMYVKSDDHYLEVVTQNDKKHTVRGKLSQIKEELPPNFIQCHRSYIVNSNYIKQVNATSLVLINKEQIPLSRSYKDKF